LAKVELSNLSSDLLTSGSAASQDNKLCNKSNQTHGDKKLFVADKLVVDRREELFFYDRRQAGQKKYENRRSQAS
jgi:hypothetical protein